jgi:hypothetical protein
MKHIVLTAVAIGAALSVNVARAEDTPPAPDTSVMATPAPTPDATPAVTPAKPKKSVAAAKPAAKPAPKPAAQPWAGTWTGTVQQVGRAQGYPIEITLTPKGGDTSYPGQNCAGKLVKLGSNADYATYVETITSGKFDPASKAGCLDGSLTIERSADGVVMSWMTGYGGKAIVAYGALMPKAK